MTNGTFLTNGNALEYTYLFLIRRAEQLNRLQVDTLAALLTVLAAALPTAPSDAPEAYRQYDHTHADDDRDHAPHGDADLVRDLVDDFDGLLLDLLRLALGRLRRDRRRAIEICVSA